MSSSVLPAGEQWKSSAANILKSGNDRVDLRLWQRSPDHVAEDGAGKGMNRRTCHSSFPARRSTRNS
jgi:hypothetical protein